MFWKILRIFSWLLFIIVLIDCFFKDINNSEPDYWQLANGLFWIILSQYGVIKDRKLKNK